MATTTWSPAVRGAPKSELLAKARRFVRSSPIGAAAAAYLLFIVALALLAPIIAPYDPLTTDYAATRRPPMVGHLLGTDHLGRDVLSRIIHGAQITLLVSISSVMIGDAIGFTWGLLSGYIGGRFDLLSQRLLEVLLAFPGIILALLLLVGLGSGFHTVIIAIAVTRIPVSTRMVRSVTLSVKEFAFVEAARSVGASPLRIVFREIAPQCVAPMLVIVSLNLGSAIFAEAALSFLGVGVPPPHATWGNMLGGVLAEAFKPPWWMVLFPGIAIASTILAANLLGDALRDFLDPTMKRQIGV